MWRVVERSDVIIHVVDARYPRFNFSPALHSLVCNDLRKPMILLLSKTDLVPPAVVENWIRSLESQYPLLHVVPFSSHPLPENNEVNPSSNSKRKMRRFKGVRLPTPVGVDTLQRALRGLGPVFRGQGRGELGALLETISLESIHRHGVKEVAASSPIVSPEDARPDESDDDQDSGPAKADTASETSGEVSTSDPIAGGLVEELEEGDVAAASDGKPPAYVTLGILGSPNAGKSTLINALTGRKVVSVSRTPGHTKHLQTIFINHTVRLCDCPGLVLPAVDQPYPLQVLFGHVNIAQVRETYSTIAYVGARIPLPDIYGLQPPPSPGTRLEDYKWSGYAIAEAWAVKRGYLTRGGGPDTHRAGNEILRDITAGRVLFLVEPTALSL